MNSDSINTLTRLFSVGLLALIAATWKLWTPQDVFPQVPLLSVACDWPGWIDWVCLVTLVSAALLVLIVGHRGRLGRIGSAGVAISLAIFFVLDQHRLQPWAWQFFLIAVVLSVADDATVRRYWGWLVVSIYFWSAISKLDPAFCRDQGPALLRGLRQAMGGSAIENRWTAHIDFAGSIGIACGELVVAVMLAWPRTRWLGLLPATLMHVALLAALGPFGLNHSAGVLLWNVFFIAQDWLLFRQTIQHRSDDGQSFVAEFVRNLRQLLACPRGAGNRAAAAVVCVAVIWPALEPFGLCDHWLAWAVYSAKIDRVVLIEDREIPISDWSLSRLAVPIYPQERFQIGVMKAIMERSGVNDFIIMEADFRNFAKSNLRFMHNPNELNQQSRRYFFNATPRNTAYVVKK